MFWRTLFLANRTRHQAGDEPGHPLRKSLLASTRIADGLAILEVIGDVAQVMILGLHFAQCRSGIG
jgi:hypothetical protein